MWDYAHEMALLNKKRDPDAKEISTETKYMYMSHYIDIRTGPRYGVDKNISNDSYFSAWIINNDGEAYELYLKGTHVARIAIYESDTFVGIADKVVNGSAPSLEKLSQVRKYIYKIAKLGNDVIQKALDLSSTFEKIKYFIEGDTPEAFMNHIKYTLGKEGYSGIEIGSVSGIIFAFIGYIFLGNVVGLLFAVGSAIYNFHAHLFKDFFDKVWWYSLILTNSLRVSGRYMRYWEANL